MSGDLTSGNRLFVIGDVSLNSRLFVGSDASINGLTVGRGTGNISTNTAFGYNALASNTTGFNNVAIGYLANTTNSTSENNTAVGCQALYNNTAKNNTAVGYQALYSNTTAIQNTAIGWQSLLSNTTGYDNTGVGYASLKAVTTGLSNSAVGSFTLASVTTGSANMGFGSYALGGITTQSDNVGVGKDAMAFTTSSNNTGIGSQCLRSNTTGGNNTAIGYQTGYAGTANTTGSNNTYIGYQAQANGNNYSNSTAIGTGATITGSNQVVLGTSTETVVAVGDASMNKRLFVGSDASFGGNIGFNKTITVSPNSTNATSDSWSSSGITWTATASTFDSGYGRYPYNQFDTAITTGAGWGTSTASYNTTSPFAYKNTTYSTVIQNSVGTVYGEWLQIASNVPVTLNSFYLYNTLTSSADAGNAPGKYYICGSSDGTTWYPIIYVNYTSYPSGNTSLQTPTWSIPSGSGSGTTTGTINTSYTVYGNSNTTYTYFRMVITNCVGNLGTGMSNNGYCFFGEWNMSFTAASSNNLYMSSSSYNTIQSDNNVIINSLTVGRGGGNIDTNTAFGVSALSSNASGSNNVALGYQSLKANTTGAYNTAVGYNALLSNTSGTSNIAIGYSTLINNTTGSTNIAIGYVAGQYSTTGVNNSSFGPGAGQYISSGTYNTCIGYQAGGGQAANSGNTTGSFNTYLGHQATANGNNYSNSTAIGKGATITASNQVVLGTTSESVTIGGKLGIGTTSPTTNLDVTGNTRLSGYTQFVPTNPSSYSSFYSNSGLMIGWNIIGATGETDFCNNAQLGTGGFAFYNCNSSSQTLTKISQISSSGTYTASDYRIKSDVQLLDSSYNVDCLIPVSYYNILSKEYDIGFIAHEVQQYYPSLVQGEKDGKEMQSLNYSGIIPILTKEIKDLKKEIQEIKGMLTKLSV